MSSVSVSVINFVFVCIIPVFVLEVKIKKRNKKIKKKIKKKEDEKKRKYKQRVLEVEMGSFTPLVFGTNGGMGNECQRFLKHLADKIAQKDTEPYNTVIPWLRKQIPSNF